MNVRYCPDCQEECRPGTDVCPECGFPMKFQVIASGDRRYIEPEYLESWNRIIDILRRGGVRVETRRPNPILSYQAWWALPILGGLVFLFTIVFGDAIAKSFWGNPLPATPILDLAQPKPDPREATTQREGNESSEVSSEDTAFLTKALEATPTQRMLADELDHDPGQFINKSEFTHDQVVSLFRQSMLLVRVKDRVRRGTLVSGTGNWLVPRDTLLGAFENYTRNRTDNGSLTQEVVYVVPMINRPGEQALESSLVRESLELGVALLRSPFSPDFECELNFDDDLRVGDEVWISLYANENFYPEKRLILDVERTPDNIPLWVIESDFGIRDSGSPVFNIYGEMCGILLNDGSGNRVLSLRRLREKAPLIFRDLKN